MRRDLPSFTSIRSFEAAARHLSFRCAAEELHVTQSAISHQVKSLEEHLGVQLFLRGTRKIALTDEGASYRDQLSLVLDQLAELTDRIGERDASGPLFVRSTPAFAARWLVPRLTAFHEAYPRIDLHISTSLGPADFAGDKVDVDIRFGQCETPGLQVDPFLTSSRFPVASPKLLNGRTSLRNPEDLRHFILLHDEVGDAWQQWLACAGGVIFDPSHGPRFAHCDLTLSAAVEGQGIALAYSALVEGDVAAGILVKVFDISLPAKVIYSLVVPRSWTKRPRIAAFRGWLLGAAAASRSPLVAALNCLEYPIRGSAVLSHPTGPWQLRER